MAQAAPRHATSAHLEAVPRNRVAEIVDGVVGGHRDSRLSSPAPFDAVSLPLADLFPFADPLPPAPPET